MSKNKNTLNFARLQGSLVSVANSNGVGANGEWLSANLVVRTGEDDNSVKIFANKFKKGTQEISKIYASLQTVINEYKTIEKNGIEEADEVSITGSINVNRYIGQDGQLKTFQQISTNFVNRKDSVQNFVAGTNTFGIKGIVDTLIPKANIDGETVALELTLIVPSVNDITEKVIIEKVKFLVDNSEYFNYIEDNFIKGNVVHVQGSFMNRIEEDTKTPVTGFGKVPQKRTRKSGLVLEGGYVLEGMEDIFPFDAETINTAMEEFNQKIVAIQSKKPEVKTTTQASSPTSNTTTGFGSVSMDDIPF